MLLTFQAMSIIQTKIQTNLSTFIKRLSSYWVEALVLLAGLSGAWLQAGWTRDLKRYQQTNWYIGFGVAYLLVFVLVGWVVLRRSEETYRRKWLSLGLLVLLPNLLNIWVRYSFEYEPGKPLFGRDADIGLFYKYGHDFASGLTPTFNGNYMEYPQFALFLFWVGERLAGGSAQNFYWVFPAWMQFWNLAAAYALYATGIKLGRGRTGWLLAAFTAVCPFLYLFNYTRFDIAPSAMLLLALYFFIPTPAKEGSLNLKKTGYFQIIGVGLAVSAGFLAKWLPAVIAPWLAIAYARAKRWKELIIFGLSAVVLSLITMLPFLLANAEAFWYPYRFQGSRRMIGESFWFLVQYFFFDNTHTVPDKPWGEPSSIILGNNKLLVAQIGLLGFVFVLSVWKLWREKLAYEAWAAASLVGVAVFTLSNRIFSPQYLVLLLWVWAAAFLLQSSSWKKVAIYFTLAMVAAAANFLVFLLAAWTEEWLKYSVILFSVGWVLSGWLLIKALNIPKEESTTLLT